MANRIDDETIEYVGILAKLKLSDQEKEQAKPAVPFAPIEPIAPETEKAAEPEPDPFDDIFKIFNRRD